ncbi:possible methyltransferase involved in ubiquinone/menaquinone biosynthesis [Aurantimonas manganoxydans SI85-9A1]|uniref:Possible methyltransferase involved in ubiquinone/menaquinone biosynthesis n=1 Tax=Aurantimonas manganoxydans (strain ATCC BAA-1229 / DSM 21871 / SI85-9A1) TaxID=287752 RepID=Q1YGS3_AURMS|nr:methyltransferase domain-containing protein [Aurantimonas manganoxydans]EAS49152.1 possible methyltransferase involved in ubiquinone/menaquinone biosynthesis [Aurantimonas manganoxydans SI85-9A1]
MAIGGDFTRRLLLDAGIERGMRVLDVGCGTGDVSLIACELVGTTGHVLGIDRDARMVDAARDRTRGAGLVNLHVEVRGMDELPAGSGPFDAIVGRRVLMYQPDVVRAVRGLAALLRPGGIVAFHEHAAGDPMASGDLPLHRTVQSWLRETVRREGGNVLMGLDLHEVLTRAGLLVKGVRAEAIVQTPTQPYPLAAIACSILPRILERKVATADEIDIETLARRLDAERLGSPATYVGDTMFGAWAQKAHQSE